MTGFRSLSYEERLHQLRLWTLKERRNRADLIEVFKIAHGLSAIPLDEMFHLDIYRRTRGHSLKLIKYRCNKDVKKYFFHSGLFQSGICWMMQAATVCVKTVNSFKTKLEMERKMKMGLFLD